MAAKKLIQIHIKVAGFVDNKMVSAEFDLETPEGTTVKKLMALADKSRKLPPRSMKRIMGLPRPPTLLVNGSNTDVPEGYKTVLKDGDEVAIMTPLGGG